MHSTVITKLNSKDSIKTYELSLFGVILVLTLVRYYDMDRLKNGLYYRNISFVDYYDKIASNYEDKLPLVFGKWRLLKNILRSYSAYNFDIILDKELRLGDSNMISIISGGNKELYYSIREIILQTRRQIGHLADAGWIAWLKYTANVLYEYEGPQNQDNDYLMNQDIHVQSGPDMQKVDVVKKKLDEIIILLNPLEHGFSKSTSLQPEVIREILHQLEKLFADEITAFYYFHLYYDYEFKGRISEPTKYYFSFKGGNQFPISEKPKSCLLSILVNDKEKPLISEWFSRWMQDISNLQKEIYETLELTTQRADNYLANHIIK